MDRAGANKEERMAVNVVDKADEFVAVKTVLVSVSNKEGLETFIPELVRLCPGARFLSTGGTFSRLREILGDEAGERLTQVQDYTGQPETQGGLVKTLDFKIYLGILTETYNDFHKADLARTGATPIDMVVVNLYPFRETVAKPGARAEDIRGQIDIGGPCMIRAAAKNFLRVAPVVEPEDYPTVLDELKKNSGSLGFRLRYRLARKAFVHTAAYDKAIAGYFVATPFDSVSPCYSIVR
jgi:phosphoribosylaminoimidazolecarboxamide formyltransferase/IMP cyclohydrolase